MATYTSDRVSTLITARDGIGVVHQICTYTVVTALATADILQLFKLPEGAIVLDLMVASGGTQGANNNSEFTVGDVLDADRYIVTANGLALRSGGGVDRLSAPTGVAYTNPADTTVDLTITVGGSGQTTGGYIRASILYVPQA